LVEENESGITYTRLSDIQHSALPSSLLPGPGIGFLVNGTIAEVETIFRLGFLRYMTDVRQWYAFGEPASPWIKTGTGSASADSEILTLDGLVSYQRNESVTTMNSAGYSIEFRTKVDSYSFNGVESPIMKNVGVGVEVDNGMGKLVLLFANAGVDIGNIVYLATETDYDVALNKICSGDTSVEGTYVKIDWALMRTYRVDFTLGGYLNLYIDDAVTPILSVWFSDFELLSSTYPCSIKFGNLSDTTFPVSSWEFLQYSLSSGVNVKIEKVSDSPRFDTAVNTVVTSFDRS
jgi:hypothetical protein